MLKTLPVLLLAALAACASSEKTVTDGDRHLSHQNLSAAKGIIERAGVIQAALIAMGMSPSGAEFVAVTWVQQAAKDIAANSDQQLKNWGGAPKDAQPYSPKASEGARTTSADEHEKIRWWHGALAAGGAVVAWAAKQFGLGWIPLVGGWLKKKAPSIALGDLSKDSVTAGLQVALDEGRTALGGALEKLKTTLKEKLPDSADAIIDEIELPDLKEIVVKEMERRGVLPANTLLYEGNPDTGAPTAT